MAIILLVSLVLLTVLLPAMSDHDHKLKNFAKTRKMFNEERYTNAYAVEVFGDEEVAKAIADKYFFQYNGKVLFSPSHNFKIIQYTHTCTHHITYIFIQVGNLKDMYRFDFEENETKMNEMAEKLKDDPMVMQVKCIYIYIYIYIHFFFLQTRV